MKSGRVRARPARWQTPQSSVSKRRTSRATIPPSKNRALPSRKNGGCHKLLRKRGALEVAHEDLHQRGSMEIGQPRNLADHPHVPETLDGFPVLAVLVADQHHAMHR